MSGFNSRYGFTGDDVSNLNHRWNYKIKSDCEWERFDDFVFWCSYTGYRKGMQLRKRNKDMPHSPDNSFWVDTLDGTQPEENDCEFCAKCNHRRSAVCINGCVTWREQWVKNWNDNICIRPPEEKYSPTRETFCYEHPDLIKEGIVWQG